MKKAFLLFLTFSLYSSIILHAGEQVPPPPSCSKNFSASIILPLAYKGFRPSIEIGPISSYENNIHLNDVFSAKISYFLDPFKIDIGWGIMTNAVIVGFSGNSTYSFLELSGHIYNYRDSLVVPCYLATGPIINLGKGWIMRLKLGFVFYVYE